MLYSYLPVFINFKCRESVYSFGSEKKLKKVLTMSHETHRLPFLPESRAVNKDFVKKVKKVVDELERND